MNKEKFIQKLQEKGIFWSYDTTRTYPDSIVIEQTLRWGDVVDIKTLFSLYNTQEIVKVWTKNMLPDQRIYGHNYYLAKVFFDIPGDVDKFIKKEAKTNDRYERIKEFTS